MSEPASFDAAYARGLDLMEMHDHLVEAEVAFRTAVTIDPKHPGALSQLGICLRAQGRIEEALPLLEMASGLAPTNALILAHLATAKRLDGRYDEAVESYTRALDLDPALDYARIGCKVANDCARIIRAGVSFDAHWWKEALADFDYLLDHVPMDEGTGNSIRSRREVAATYMAEEKATGCEYPSEAKRERAIALYRRGNQLSIEGDLDRALRCYNAAMLLDTSYEDPAYPIGETVPTWEKHLKGGRRLSCRWLESGLHLHHEGLFFCCPTRTGDKPWADIGPFNGGRLPVDIVLARRAQLIRALEFGNDNVCDGCHFLEKKEWPRPQALFESLIINNHTACNMWCSYCGLAKADFSMPAYAYRVEPLLGEMISAGWLARGADVAWGGGDPSLSRDFPGGSAKLLEHGCTLGLYTNAVYAPEPMIEAIRSGQSDVWISVDAGTPETFYRLKFRGKEATSRGRPVFESVWENIARYIAASPSAIHIKYVLTEENLDEAELDGFVARCKVVGVPRIILTPENLVYISGQTSRQVSEAMVRLEMKAKAAGIDVSYYFFGHPDVAAPPSLHELRGGGTIPVAPSLEYLRRLIASRELGRG